MNNFFSIVIPTMWMSDKIQSMLLNYEKCDLIKEIIIIDNNPNSKIDLKKYKKVIYYTEDTNIFVNPAWNIGNLLSNHRLLLVNDDIIIEDIQSVLELLLNTDYDIVGVKLGEKNGGMKINPIEVFPKNHFGSFMYVKNYYHIPNNIKIWFGDDLQFNYNSKKGILVNSGIVSNESKTVNIINNSVINEVYLQDKKLYSELVPKINNKKDDKDVLSILAVLVNYGDEQIEYLKQVVNELKSFKKYNVTVIVNSNIDLNISGVDIVNVYKNLDDYQLLPITCRKTMWEYRNDYDVFIFGENDHLFKEIHIDRYLEYVKILPKNKIAGLIQYEENEFGKYYPAYHKHYDWDYNSVEIHGGKLFAHFKNIHQATFILTKEQLNNIGETYDFTDFYGPKTQYSVKCRVNTDIYGHSGLKKLICISDFKDNLIHHLPNVYINGDKGRNKNQRSEQTRMNNAVIKLFNFDRKKIVCGVATIYERRKSLKKVVKSIINQVDELYVYQNDYKEIFDFLNDDKIKVISSVDTGVNMGDAGKFYTVENHKDCYYLSIDDDIIYPNDYVLSIVEGIKKYNNNSIVTHHGRSFNKNAKNYHTDYIDYVHFRKKNKTHKEVHFPGTGVMGFYTNTFNIKFSDFEHKNIADVIVGIEAGKRNLKCFCLPHDLEWLKDSETLSNTNLFEQNKTNTELNEFFNKNLHIVFEINPTLPQHNIIQSKNILENIGFNPNKKPITNVDYDKINKTLKKEFSTVTQNRVENQNKPKNRQETIQLKKDSLIQQNKKLKSVRPTRNNLIPNVFGGKKRI